MKEDFGILKNSSLFHGIDPEDISNMLSCLSAQRIDARKGEYIWAAGDEAAQVGMVLSGGVTILQEDYWGNRAILAKVLPGELFGEAFSFGDSAPLPVSVVASEGSRLVFLNCGRMIQTCSNACAFHARLIENMLGILADKNRMLTQKMSHLVKRTTREKLLSYLSAQAVREGNGCFSIPYNRQELADYLAVDRSAMSKELCRLRDDGVLWFHKNSFELRRFEKVDFE